MVLTFFSLIPLREVALRRECYGVCGILTISTPNQPPFFLLGVSLVDMLVSLFDDDSIGDLDGPY
jgi:hypothetical protein